MQSMIFFLVLSMVFFLLFLMKNSNRSEKIQKYEAFGRITKRIEDGSTTMYYVQFADGDVIHIAQSIYYSETNRKYCAGDTVPILYYYTAKGTPRVEIRDDELTSCREKMQKFVPLWLGISILFFFLAVILFICKVI